MPVLDVLNFCLRGPYFYIYVNTYSLKRSLLPPISSHDAALSLSYFIRKVLHQLVSEHMVFVKSSQGLGVLYIPSCFTFLFFTLNLLAPGPMTWYW